MMEIPPLKSTSDKAFSKDRSSDDASLILSPADEGLELDERRSIVLSI